MVEVSLAAVRWGSAGALVLTALAIMGSPGPATISLTAAGSAYGVRRSLGYLVGIVAGTTIVLVAVGTGITATLLAVPALRSVLIAISVAYILWLAYHVATAPPLAAQSAASNAPTLGGGTLLGVANPKAWVAIGAVFAGNHLATSATGDAAAKIAVLTVMIVLQSALPRDADCPQPLADIDVGRNLGRTRRHRTSLELSKKTEATLRAR